MKIIFLITITYKIRGSLNKFPDFFRKGTFIDNAHMKLKSPTNESPPAAMHLLYHSNNFWKAPMEVLLCERVNDLRHSFFHLLDCLIMIASYELRE